MAFHELSDLGYLLDFGSLILCRSISKIQENPESRLTNVSGNLRISKLENVRSSCSGIFENVLKCRWSWIFGSAKLARAGAFRGPPGHICCCFSCWDLAADFQYWRRLGAVGGEVLRQGFGPAEGREASPSSNARNKISCSTRPSTSGRGAVDLYHYTRWLPLWGLWDGGRTVVFYRGSIG